MFGAGGGTSSYREVEETDVLFLWGANARDAHPIFFHHVLKGVRQGATLFVVDNAVVVVVAVATASAGSPK